jgi:hypothetical protein
MKKETITAMSDLDFAIQQSEFHVKKSNEFTSTEYVERVREEFPDFTRDQAKTRLQKMVNQGWLTYRIIPVNGAISKVYSAVRES